MTINDNTPGDAGRADTHQGSSSSTGCADIALIIVNYFTAAHLRKCLAAVAEQTLVPDKVLIVNNGDRPHALDFIGTIYPFVQIVESNNIGFAAANNLALQLLENYTWIAMLNPDAFPEPDWLAQLMLGVQHNPFADFFSSQLVQAPAPDLLDGQGDCYHVSGLAWRNQHGCKRRTVTDDAEVFSACAAAALFRRKVLAEVGGFDESYFCYFEDVDLGFRLRLRGFRCVYVPTAVVRHVGSVASGGEQSDFAVYHGHRNLVWTFVKNMPGFWFWLLLPLHIVLNIVEIIWFSTHGRAKVICRAKLDAIKSLPTVWLQRQQVQELRTVSSSTILKSMSLWPLIGNR
jgi:GT2 family glycosyltransferase